MKFKFVKVLFFSNTVDLNYSCLLKIHCKTLVQKQHLCVRGDFKKNSDKILILGRMFLSHKIWVALLSTADAFRPAQSMCICIWSCDLPFFRMSLLLALKLQEICLVSTAEVSTEWAAIVQEVWVLPGWHTNPQHRNLKLNWMKQILQDC